MAKVTMDIPLTNKLGDYSLYKMKGVDKMIIRRKGGPSKEQIKNDPEFNRFRSSSSELSGAGKVGGLIMQTSKAINHLADHKYCGMLTKVCRAIQTMDPTNDPGKRSILLSEFGNMLAGVNFNEQQGIETVLKHLPEFTISRNDCKATVIFPDLFPGINLANPWKHPLYRLVLTLGNVQDMIYGSEGYDVADPSVVQHKSKNISDWFSTGAVLPAQTMEVALPNLTIPDSNILVLSIGVQFGRLISNVMTEPVKKAGCAKILGVG